MSMVFSAQEGCSTRIGYSVGGGLHSFTQCSGIHYQIFYICMTAPFHCTLCPTKHWLHFLMLAMALTLLLNYELVTLLFTCFKIIGCQHGEKELPICITLLLSLPFKMCAEKSWFNEWSAHFESLNWDFTLNGDFLTWNSNMVTKFSALNRDFMLNGDSLNRDFTVYVHITAIDTNKSHP